MKPTIHIAANQLNTEGDELTDTILREGQRLFTFIRSKVPESEDAEDILQDVFYQLSSTGIESIDQVSSWLFTVARNRITDQYRKKKAQAFSKRKDKNGHREQEGPLTLAEILPDLSSAPDEIYLRGIILDELEEALSELPEEQRNVFVMHEFEDRSFKEISAELGVAVNTLLSRKRYAVLYLRKRLQALYQELLQV